MITTLPKIKEQLNEQDWDFIDSSSDLIHNMHPYPAKFIAEIPRTLIKYLPIPADSLIFDPFCGSGVTLIEAQRAGIESLGIDLNPIACLISKVKTQPLADNFLTAVKETVAHCISFKGNIVIPNITNLDHWFKKEIQIGLTILLNKINSFQDNGLKDALKFCFSSIVVKVSNQDSDTRYAAVQNNLTKRDIFTLFLQVAQKLFRAKTSFSFLTSATIINKNSLLLRRDDFQKKIGLVITSPPYPNAYEYWLYHKYRMWWLGYDPISVKDQEIGARAHYFKKDYQTEEDFIVQMQQLFDFMNNMCAENAFICFVIGRSKIHGRIIENEILLEKIGKKSGLQHIITIERTIKSSRKSFNLSHARIKKEFIVILQK